MKCVIFVLLCLLAGTFGRPNFEDNFAPILSNFDEIFPKEDARIRRSSSNESAGQSSVEAGGLNITQLLQIIPGFLSGNLTVDDVLSKVSVQNIKNVLNQLIPFNNAIIKVPLIGNILQLLQIILSGVLSLLISIITLVISVLIQVVKILGL